MRFISLNIVLVNRIYEMVFHCPRIQSIPLQIRRGWTASSQGIHCMGLKGQRKIALVFYCVRS